MMSFILKNVGATYLCLINKMFKYQIGYSIKVYIDNMFVKNMKADRHIADLEEASDELQRYQMKLNPNKCIFRVTSRKFLDFPMTQ